MTIAVRGVPDAALKDIADFAAKFFYFKNARKFLNLFFIKSQTNCTNFFEGRLKSLFEGEEICFSESSRGLKYPNYLCSKMLVN